MVDVDGGGVIANLQPTLLQIMQYDVPGEGFGLVKLILSGFGYDRLTMIGLVFVVVFRTSLLLEVLFFFFASGFLEREEEERTFPLRKTIPLLEELRRIIGIVLCVCWFVV